MDKKITNLENAENLEAKDYFDLIKNKKHQMTQKDLDGVYNNCMRLAKKAKITGQAKALKKLLFHIENIEKEKKVLDFGIDKFVYEDDISYYIDKVADESVKIIELNRYEREIPDEIVEVVEKLKNHETKIKDENGTEKIEKGIFDEYYVLFTDYTDNTLRETEKDRKEKDPILFGTFQDKKTDSIVQRFYFIGDWVDEYCDLTLDKFVNEYKRKENKDVKNTIKNPKELDELRIYLKELEETENSSNFRHVKKETKKTIFERVRTFLKKD